MSKLSFNKDHKIDDFTFIIARRDFYKYGVIKGTDVTYRDNFNAPDEISLSVHKTQDISQELWERINEYNILIVPELGDYGYFDIEVDLNEDENGVKKSITGRSLAESELSQTKIYNYEVNTEQERINDEEWDKDYLTVLYRQLPDPAIDPDGYKRMKHVSLIHRILDKTPNYTIDHVDDTLVNLTEWYQFSWDDRDIYSILTGDVAQQYHVLFKFNSRNRSISIYDLYSVCNNDNCSYRTKMRVERNITTRFRGDFFKKCPYCNSTDITPGYGKFTNIFVSKDNLSTSASVRSNKDSLVNSFKVKSGDDLMDAAVANQNPNGSNYIFQFSAECKEQMPPELVTALESYTTEYDKYYLGDQASGKGIYTFTQSEVNQYNPLVTGLTGHFTEDTLENFITLNRTYTGYQSLAAQYYSVLDLEAFYESSMCPDVETNHDSLQDTKTLLQTSGNLSPIAVMNPATVTQGMVESAIIQSAKCIINTALYDLTPNTEYFSPAATEAGTGTWRGTITIVSIEHKGTIHESENTLTTNTIPVTINGNVALYVKQKIDKLIARKKAEVKPLTSLIDLKPLAGLVNVPVIEDSASAKAAFREQLHYYSYEHLVNIAYPCFQDVLSIVQENSNKINSLYYDIYYTRLRYIEEETAVRNTQVNLLHAIKEKFENYRKQTQTILNFRDYLGEEMYNLFCSYRREQTYQNSNYISDNLSNNELMKRAGDLLDYAQKELYKASSLQYEVSGNLLNLLALPEFASIFDDFDTGNWIHMSVDDKVYNLRLLSYQVNFNDLQNIDVTFSTVEKIWTGASDIQSVLKAAGNIAGSYSNTQSQVKQFGNSSDYVKGWVRNGLAATLTKFVDDPLSQEIVYDSSGFYARSWDEISQSYLPQQLKINKNGMYLTDDGWATLSTGVGAFTYTDPETSQVVNTYGVIAKTVVGQLILGENLKIYNGNAKFKMDGNGMILTNGKNTFTVNPNNNSKLLSIANTTQDLFWVDNNGMLHIRGDGSGLDISSNAKFSDYSTTTQMNTAISTSVNGLATTVSQTYETKTDANSKKQALETTITQTANSITLSASQTYETKTNASSNYNSLDDAIEEVETKRASLEVTVNGISSTVSSHTTSINGLNTWKTSAQSSIEQNASDITLKVSETDYTGATIASKINQSASTVTISAAHINLTGNDIGNRINGNATTVKIAAGRITLEGIVTANNNFKILSDGSMEAKNGKFSGALTATSLSTGSRTSSGTGTAGTYIDSNGNVYVGGGNQTILYANGNAQIGGTNGIKYSNNKVTFGSDCVITFDGSGYVSESTFESRVTTITSDTISTTNVVAQNLHVNSVNINGTITADAINATTATLGSYWHFDSNGRIVGIGTYASSVLHPNYISLFATAGRFIELQPFSTGSTITIDSMVIGDGIVTGNYVQVNGTTSLQLTSATSIDITSGSTLALFSGGTTLVLSHNSNCIRPSTNGTTDLGNSSHRWSTVYASSLDVTTFSINSLSLSGSLSAGTISCSSLTSTGSISGNTIGGTSVTGGSISLSSNTIAGSSSSFYITGGSTSVALSTSGAFVSTGSDNLGNSSHLWANVYSSNATIQTSDRKDKDILGSIDYAEDLIMSLSPTRYMWKKGDHRRTRMGFIAQDVAKICKDLNQNLSLVTASYKVDSETEQGHPKYGVDYLGEDVDDEELVWGMAYNELIAPMVAVMQKQQRQIEALQQELSSLKNKNE